MTFTYYVPGCDRPLSYAELPGCQRTEAEWARLERLESTVGRDHEEDR